MVARHAEQQSQTVGRISIIIDDEHTRGQRELSQRLRAKPGDCRWRSL
jgi:hypothetical protein